MTRDRELNHEGPAAMPQAPANRPMTTVEMLNELARRGCIVPDYAGRRQPHMPSAYRFVPSVTAAGSIPNHSAGMEEAEA